MDIVVGFFAAFGCFRPVRVAAARAATLRLAVFVAVRFVRVRVAGVRFADNVRAPFFAVRFAFTVRFALPRFATSSPLPG